MFTCRTAYRVAGYPHHSGDHFNRLWLGVAVHRVPHGCTMDCTIVCMQSCTSWPLYTHICHKGPVFCDLHKVQTCAAPSAHKLVCKLHRKTCHVKIQHHAAGMPQVTPAQSSSVCSASYHPPESEKSGICTDTPAAWLPVCTLGRTCSSCDVALGRGPLSPLCLIQLKPS